MTVITDERFRHRAVAVRAGRRRPLASALVAAARSGIDHLLSWQERTRQRHHLSGLDDRLLKDMGISRADVMRETDKPFWEA